MRHYDHMAAAADLRRTGTGPGPADGSVIYSPSAVVGRGHRGLSGKTAFPFIAGPRFLASWRTGTAHWWVGWPFAGHAVGYNLGITVGNTSLNVSMDQMRNSKPHLGLHGRLAA